MVRDMNIFLELYSYIDRHGFNVSTMQEKQA